MDGRGLSDQGTQITEKGKIMMDFGFYNMDCMEGMKEFPDKYFHLAIVDPPYGSCGGGFANDSRFGERFARYNHSGETWHGIKHGCGHWKYSDVKWDIAPQKEYFEELFRVSKNQIIWGGNYFTLPATRCFLIWRKTSVPQNFTMAMCEYAWTSFNDNAKVFDFSAVGIPGRFHPTQKPVELYKWILNNYSKDGEIILDTHVGSGSSLVACRETGHKYVGFEIDPEYYAKAKERVDAAEAQMTLFDFGYNPYQE